MDVLTLIEAENIIDGMADALIILDNERKIIGINQATLDLFEYTKEDLLGKPIVAIFPGSEALFISKKIKEIESKGPVRNYVTVSHSKGENKIPVSLSMAHLKDRQEAVIGTICIGKDMREVKRNIQQLRDLATLADRTATIQREKAKELSELNIQLEKANRAKSEFLVNMSHELRTPLNSIIGFSEVLLNKNVGEVNLKQEEYLNDILDSGKHLLSLINDILDLSKVESGKEELTVTEFHLPQLMEESLSMFQEKSLKYNLKLSLEVPTTIENVLADKRKIKQVIFNLLSNATKFTPPGGKITLGAKETEDEYFISVQDTGIGISKEEYDVIFEKFKQLESGYSKKYAGTGIGLALVKQLVELHRGKIWVESEVGKGSTFIFSLPKNLDYKIFEIYMNDVFDTAIVEGLFLAFIIIKIEKKEDETRKDDGVYSNQVIEDLGQIVKKALYRPGDKVFKLRKGFCAIALGKTGRDSVEIVFNRIKGDINNYKLHRRIETEYVIAQMFTYPDDIKTKEEVIIKLKEFGLYET